MPYGTDRHAGRSTLHNQCMPETLLLFHSADTVMNTEPILQAGGGKGNNTVRMARGPDGSKGFGAGRGRALPETPNPAPTPGAPGASQPDQVEADCEPSPEEQPQNPEPLKILARTSVEAASEPGAEDAAKSMSVPTTPLNPQAAAFVPRLSSEDSAMVRLQTRCTLRLAQLDSYRLPQRPYQNRHSAVKLLHTKCVP